MPFVIDASIAGAWILPDETDALAADCQRALLVDHAIVPAIWWFETRDLLLMSERRGRLDRTATARALEILAVYPIIRDEQPDGSTLLDLARVHGLTAYDAAYLELAVRTKSPIATLDKRLSAAAQKENIAAFAGAGR
jgi:predicted nucleic acid-binding protein